MCNTVKRTKCRAYVSDLQRMITSVMMPILLTPMYGVRSKLSEKQYGIIKLVSYSNSFYIFLLKQKLNSFYLSFLHVEDRAIEA